MMEENGPGEYILRATYQETLTDLGCGWSLDFLMAVLCVLILQGYSNDITSILLKKDGTGVIYLNISDTEVELHIGGYHPEQGDRDYFGGILGEDIPGNEGGLLIFHIYANLHLRGKPLCSKTVAYSWS